MHKSVLHFTKTPLSVLKEASSCVMTGSDRHQSDSSHTYFLREHHSSLILYIDTWFIDSLNLALSSRPYAGSRDSAEYSQACVTEKLLEDSRLSTL